MRWPPYQYIFFDCDSTLTAVEGIDVLAESVGKKETVEALTNAAMDGAIDLDAVYAERLQAVNPTRRQVNKIRDRYKKHVVPDAAQVIEILMTLGHHIYIISGGLYEPVKEFGVWLGVPEKNIQAVQLRYDTLAGDWWQHNEITLNDQYAGYESGSLTLTDGKADIVQAFLARDASGLGHYKTRSLLIGDGSSDLQASRSVDLFVGYGGVVKRQNVLESAPAYIHSQSLTPLLALVLGPAGLNMLKDTPYPKLIEKSLHSNQTGELTFNHEQLRQKFQQAYQTIFTRPH